MSSSVERAQALLNAHSCLRRSYYSKISVDVVRLMLDDVWAEALRVRSRVGCWRGLALVAASCDRVGCGPPRVGGVSVSVAASRCGAPFRRPADVSTCRVHLRRATHS